MIDELCAILGDDGKDVRIEADGVEADEVADLAQLPDTRIRTLKLERMSAGPTLVVEVRSRSQRIVILHPGNETVGIAYRAARVLRRRRRLARLLRSAALYVVGLLMAGVALWLTVRDLSVAAVTVLALAAVICVGSVVLLFTSRFDRSVILTRRRAENPGFFSRNRDALGVGVLLALVGFILGKLT